MEGAVKAYMRCMLNSNEQNTNLLSCLDNFIFRSFSANHISPPEFENIDRSWYLTEPSGFFYSKVALMILAVLFYFTYIPVSQYYSSYERGDAVVVVVDSGERKKRNVDGKSRRKKIKLLAESVVLSHALLCAWMILGIFLGFCAWFDRKIYDKQYFRNDIANAESFLMFQKNTTMENRCEVLYPMFADIVSQNLNVSYAFEYSNETMISAKELANGITTALCARLYVWCGGNVRCYAENSGQIVSFEFVDSNVSSSNDCIIDYDYDTLRSFSSFTLRLVEKMNDLKIFCFVLPLLSVVTWYERTSFDIAKSAKNGRLSNSNRLIYNVYLLSVLGCIYFGLSVWDSSLNYSYAHHFDDASKVKPFGEIVFDYCFPKKNDVSDDMARMYETTYFKTHVFRWRSLIVCAFCVGWATLDILLERVYELWIKSKIKKTN